MLFYKSKPVKRLGKRRQASFTVPDQSMSIKTIIDRYTRGIPVDLVQRDAVYIDQSDYDLEKLNRMDFADKAAMAAEMRAANVETVERIKDERAERERKEKAKQDSPRPPEAASKSAGEKPAGA